MTMLILLWKEILSFLEKVSDKSYKAVIIFLTALFMASSIAIINKVTALNDKIERLSIKSSKQDSALEDHLNSKIDHMYSDASDLFQGYATSNTEDLKTIIDNSAITASNGAVIKKLVEKSTADIIQEVKKIQFRNRYLKDTISIEAKKLSFVKSFSHGK
jgi:hypothetical protein